MLYEMLPHHPIVHETFAVTPDNTKSIQDCFRIKVNDSGATLRIMAVIPQFETFIRPLFTKSLEEQLRTRSQKSSVSFFSPESKEEFSLKLGKVSDVLIVEYRFNEFDELISQHIYTGRAKLVRHLTFTDYEKYSEKTKHMELIRQIMQTKDILRKSYTSDHAKDLKDTRGSGAEFVFLALECFNEFCRAFCRINKIPFVSPPVQRNQGGFRVSLGMARFNHGTVNACSFINSANLVHHLHGLNPLKMHGKPIIESLPTI